MTHTFSNYKPSECSLLNVPPPNNTTVRHLSSALIKGFKKKILKSFKKVPRGVRTPGFFLKTTKTHPRVFFKNNKNEDRKQEFRRRCEVKCNNGPFLLLCFFLRCKVATTATAATATAVAKNKKNNRISATVAKK